jgi:hypothetical protein
MALASYGGLKFLKETLEGKKWLEGVVQDMLLCLIVVEGIF